ncbi:ATP-binding protein [Vibrio hannami]|uniref:sensor histidine kinase n=1 Tax=Vibrio hannami TaxID=2717094 RepID=UPI0024106DBE|nr:ATP-binding protein [Vibrio hannami]MDG3085749.1 ATP-binding protein [Vibrio hannami]
METVDESVVHQTMEVNYSLSKASDTVLQFIVFVSILGTASFVLVLLISLKVGNSVVSRIGDLLESVKKVTTGNLNHESKVRGNDEIGTLSAAFNEMTSTLRKTTVSKDYLDSLLANMNESLIVVSASGKIEVVNDNALATLKYSKEELLGKQITELITVEDTSEQLGHSDIATKRTDGFLVTKEGERVPVQLSSSRLLNSADSSEGVIFVATDISQLKQVQKELEHSNTELKLTQEQLIQASKLASIGELTAGIAHELNQPLMIIRNGSQLLERKRVKGLVDDSHLEGFVSSVLSNSKRMMSIIDHLRTFSRQTSKEFQEVDVKKVINDCFFMVGEQLKLKGINTEVELAEDRLFVSGVPYQLEQVMLNLLGNARDAISDSDAQNKDILIIAKRSDSDDKFIEVLIVDSGNGIDDEIKTKIYDPFFTTKDEGKGTGLGLSISYGIIKDHKGSIDVAKTSKDGTTMRITLPVLDDAELTQN